VNDLPDNLKVDAEIIVDYSVSQADDFVPFHFRVFFLELVGQPVCGLAISIELAAQGRPFARVDKCLFDVSTS
jgi:hypothetical protein